MINRYFQNLPGRRICAPSGAGDTRFKLPGGPAGALENIVCRLRARLVDFDRKRRIEHENRKAIAHLQSLSDAHLRDVGIARTDIERAVRYGKESV
jgi:uncharacterized protein YjiS (DUF1127 family)